MGYLFQSLISKRVSNQSFNTFWERTLVSINQSIRVSELWGCWIFGWAFEIIIINFVALSVESALSSLIFLIILELFLWLSTELFKHFIFDLLFINLSDLKDCVSQLLDSSFVIAVRYPNSNLVKLRLKDSSKPLASAIWLQDRHTTF